MSRLQSRGTGLIQPRSGYHQCPGLPQRCVPGRCAQRSADLHEDRPHPLNRIHPQNKYRGTCGVDQRDLGHQHCDDSTGSAREHHEPPQHHVPADQYHLELDESRLGQLHQCQGVSRRGGFKADVPMGTQTYTASGLTPLTAYTLGTRTEGPAGAINATWVNNTSTTAPAPPVPPASITNLHNTTYQQTTITWNWTDPSSAGYTNARVFLNDVFQADVPKGVQTFTKTGLTPSTAYTLKINTEGPIGFINATWVTNTATTAPFRPRASRTSTTPRTSRPVSPGTGRIQARPTSPMSRCISTGCSRPMCPRERDLHSTGLTPLTAYDPGDEDRGTCGRNQRDLGQQHIDDRTGSTSPGSPASITNLHNTTYQQTTITWNWTDPSSAGYIMPGSSSTMCSRPMCPKECRPSRRPASPPQPHTPSK